MTIICIKEKNTHTLFLKCFNLSKMHNVANNVS